MTKGFEELRGEINILSRRMDELPATARTSHQDRGRPHGARSDRRAYGLRRGRGTALTQMVNDAVLSADEQTVLLAKPWPVQAVRTTEEDAT